MGRHQWFHFPNMVVQAALGFALLLAVLLGFGASSAQAQSGYAQADLDAMIAPIALYPDDLLGQILIATTYPDDVADARAYMDDHPSLSGSLLAYQVSNAPWDDSVKSLTQFPAVLAMIDDQPDWTDAVGYAFLNQQGQVMRTVQRLRQRAWRAGTLVSNSQQRVDVSGNYITILPARSGYYYMPYYDPQVVYGQWWWPDRQPYYWEPPVRYRPSGYALGSGIFFAASVGVLNSIFHPVRPDWRRRQIIVGGGNRPGNVWKWTARPERPSAMRPSNRPGAFPINRPANRPVRPNQPPKQKPVLKPAPQRPVPTRPGNPQAQPGRPQPPTGVTRPEPQRQGQGTTRPEPQRPQIQPTPATPVTRPAPVERPVTRPGEMRPERPAIERPTVEPPKVERPTVERPAVTPPAETPAARPEAMRPARPEAMRPARPEAMRPTPTAPVAPPAPVERPRAVRPPQETHAPAPPAPQAERPAMERPTRERPAAQEKQDRRDRKADEDKKQRQDQP